MNLRDAATEYVPFEMGTIEQSICSRFEEQVAAFPARPAVVTESRSYTYAELNAAANRIGRTLLAQGVANTEPVALLLGQEALTVAAMLGVLKSGRIYLRLDPAWPVERIAQVLENSGANVVLTVQAHWCLAESVARGKQRIVDCENLAPETKDSNLGRAIPPEAPAFIIYTSGSTGQSKGVLHSHRNALLDIMNYTNQARISSADTFSLCTSLSFAMSMRHLYAALLNGASLFPLDLAGRGFVALEHWLQANAISMLCLPPTAFRSFCDGLAPDVRFPSIRVLRIVGEALSGEDVRRYRHHFQTDCVVLHGLGPTEALGSLRNITRMASCEVKGKLPLGRPVPGKEVLLLDEAGQAVAAGQVGEFVVRSKYLALGYWRRPDLTEAAFFSDPRGGEERLYRTGDLGMIREDGTMIHVGRRDFQVKIRGYRIELSEIEVTLRSFDSVKAAVVIAHARDDGEKALVGYVVPADGVVPSASDLRRDLGRVLPEYMVPASFVWMDRLPTLPNGKVDRNALAPPQRPLLSEPYVAASTATQESIARIWADLLGLDAVGVNDPFLELGGDSLMAFRVISRMRDLYGFELPLKVIFETPTVAGLAAHVDRVRPSRRAG